MKCPQCAFDNKPGKKFCIECGTKLTLKCPECGSEIEGTEKFCGECGRNLATPSEPAPKELSFDEKIDKIQRYLPKGLDLPPRVVPAFKLVFEQFVCLVLCL